MLLYNSYLRCEKPARGHSISVHIMQSTIIITLYECLTKKSSWILALPLERILNKVSQKRTLKLLTTQSVRISSCGWITVEITGFWSTHPRNILCRVAGSSREDPQERARNSKGTNSQRENA